MEGEGVSCGPMLNLHVMDCHPQHPLEVRAFVAKTIRIRRSYLHHGWARHGHQWHMRPWAQALVYAGRL